MSKKVKVSQSVHRLTTLADIHHECTRRESKRNKRSARRRMQNVVTPQQTTVMSHVNAVYTLKSEIKEDAVVEPPSVAADEGSHPSVEDAVNMTWSEAFNADMQLWGRNFSKFVNGVMEVSEQQCEAFNKRSVHI